MTDHHAGTDDGIGWERLSMADARMLALNAPPRQRIHEYFKHGPVPPVGYEGTALDFVEQIQMADRLIGLILYGGATESDFDWTNPPTAGSVQYNIGAQSRVPAILSPMQKRELARELAEIEAATADY
jgi:hypothetical protein